MALYRSTFLLSPRSVLSSQATVSLGQSGLIRSVSATCQNFSSRNHLLSLFCRKASSHISEQEEIISSFIKDPEEFKYLNELPKSKRNLKEKPHKSSVATKEIADFVAVKKNPRNLYKRGRVAKLVMRCAGEVLCGETNFGHLILLEQVRVSEDLLQATITWSARSSSLDSLIDYSAVTCQLENLCGHIQLQMNRTAYLRRIPQVKFEQSTANAS
jgi:ribosome-binding factor A